MNKLPSLLVSLTVLLAIGCNAAHQSNTAPMAAPWSFAGHDGRLLQTEHYCIYTTIADPALCQQLSTLMESALTQYKTLAPDIVLQGGPMPCYVFERRAEWTLYTREQTGAFAAIYLKINRGGYTIGDRYVAYLIGSEATFAVAAHEGWHQFVARNFKTRLPPFLEEGIATMFESIDWTAGTPQWDFSINPARAGRIRAGLENHELWSLQQLCTMHAGNVVGLSGRRIETFYAQDWAFAQFLLHGQHGKYQAKFRTMMRELGDGSANRFAALPAGAQPGAWNPKSVQPLLEHYLQTDIVTLDGEFQRFLRDVAFPAGSSSQLQ